MLWILNAFASDLLFYYGMVFTLFYLYLIWRGTSTLEACALSIAFVLVASEYYEIPIFFVLYGRAFAGAGPWPHWINHSMAFVAFIIWVNLARIRWNLISAGLLVMGPLITALFLLGPYHMLYQSRMLGAFILFLITLTSSERVGDRTASKTPRMHATA